jgi:ribonuclease HII
MVGVDEVGRGCWAGPLLVVAARAQLELPPGLKDSKLLSAPQRDKFYELLIEPCSFGEGWVSVGEINKLGLSKACRLGAMRALRALAVEPGEQIIIDGNFNYCPKKFTNVVKLVKADNKVPLVSAASIYAKVKRDRYMRSLASKYADYSFEDHVGYGTKAHARAISDHGIIDGLHRLNYAPIMAARSL